MRGGACPFAGGGGAQGGEVLVTAEVILLLDDKPAEVGESGESPSQSHGGIGGLRHLIEVGSGGQKGGRVFQPAILPIRRGIPVPIREARLRADRSIPRHC